MNGTGQGRDKPDRPDGPDTIEQGRKRTWVNGQSDGGRAGRRRVHLSVVPSGLSWLSGLSGLSRLWA
ncbi:hypothetical protein SALBM217S_05757 [Streptomyces griseoloalbus]